MNPYAIPPLVAWIFSLILGIYIISRHPRSRVNQIVGLAMFILSLSCVGVFGLRLSTTVASAEIWDRLLWSAIAFMGPVFLHVALLTSRRKKILDNRAIYLILYLPPLLFLLLTWGTNFLVADFVTRSWGLDPQHGAIVMAPVVYNSIFFILGIGFFSQAYRRSIFIEKKQNLILLMGLVVIYLGSFMGSALLPQIFDIPEVAYLFNIPGGILIVWGIVKYELFIISPITKFFIPMPEPSLSTKPKYKLKPGRSYSIKEKEPKQGAEMFKDAVSHGIAGLWVTSSLPGKVERRFDLVKTPILSMIAQPIEGEMTVDPNKLGRVKGILLGYLKRTQRAVLLIDCLYELSAANGFEKAFGFLKEIRQICSERGDNLIVTFDPRKFTKVCVADIDRILG